MMGVLQVFPISGRIFVMSSWLRPACFLTYIFDSGGCVMRKTYKTLASTENQSMWLTTGKFFEPRHCVLYGRQAKKRFYLETIYLEVGHATKEVAS
jgi:hypothetical protein